MGTKTRYEAPVLEEVGSVLGLTLAPPLGNGNGNGNGNGKDPWNPSKGS